MIPLCRLDLDTKCRTQSGRFLYHVGNLLFQNEVGQIVRPKDYDEPCEVIQEWPCLAEHQPFGLLTKRAEHPSQLLVFQLDNGFRFQTRMKDYRITIPFVFQTIDPRVPLAKAEWSARSGRILKHLIGTWPLSISFKESLPQLEVGYSGITISKQ